MTGLDDVINVRMLSHPINWAIVLIVVLIGSFALREIRTAVVGGCACKHASA